MCSKEERSSFAVSEEMIRFQVVSLAYKKETAINDGFSVTKLPGLLLRLQHHTNIKSLCCQTIL